MRTTLRYLLPLLAALAGLAVVADALVSARLRSWAEHDVALRSAVVVRAAQPGLAVRWPGGRDSLLPALFDLVRDERILGAAVCTLDGNTIAATEGIPTGFGCRTAARHASDSSDGSEAVAMSIADAAGGRIHTTIARVARDTSRGEPGGQLVLIHDLDFASRREETTRRMLLVGFLLLAIGASAATMAVAHLTRRDWLQAIRMAMRGEEAAPFAPLLADVRALARRLIDDGGAGSDAWSPDRLRRYLRDEFGGERLLLAANREPYIHEHTPDGIRVLHPASGLVTALEPVMRACSGTWIAHGSGSADRDVVDAADRVRVPPEQPAYTLRRVWMTPEEEAGYYYGFANEGLWPLCHVAHTRPSFRASDWAHYVEINRRFADAIVREADRDDPIVLVQDYHFALVPRLVRDRLPRATILAFWHIPWPNAERFGICPWRTELLDGLLGASVLGFHTRQHCNHFMDAVDSYMESRLDREATAVVRGEERTLVRPYPISIAWPEEGTAPLADVPAARATVRARLGLDANVTLGVGVDRLDYTKGIEERLQAVDTFLTRHPEWRGRLAFAQIAAPSRTQIPQYQELGARVQQLADDINARWQTGTWRPIHLLISHHEREDVDELFRAADFCYVSSLHDGMNLVAKEFVAARHDERGVLLLSQFTGAARELTGALMVNPYDIGRAADAIHVAVTMPPAEQAERMRAMRRIVRNFNVYRWAGQMLVDASEVRRTARLHGRLVGDA